MIIAIIAPSDKVKKMKVIRDVLRSSCTSAKPLGGSETVYATHDQMPKTKKRKTEDDKNSLHSIRSTSIFGIICVSLPYKDELLPTGGSIALLVSRAFECTYHYRVLKPSELDRSVVCHGDIRVAQAVEGGLL